MKEESGQRIEDLHRQRIVRWSGDRNGPLERSASDFRVLAYHGGTPYGYVRNKRHCEEDRN